MAAGVGPDPWERQPRETGKSFAAFQMYRDQPPAERSLRKLAATMGQRPELLYRWSVKYHWQDRVAAWDSEQDRILRTATINERKQMLKRLSATGVMMQSKGISRIRGLQDRVDRDGRPVSLQPGQQYIDQALSVLDATRLVESGARLEAIGRVVDPEAGDAAAAAGGGSAGGTVVVMNNPILAQLAQRPEAVSETTIAMQRLAGLLGLDRPPQAPDLLTSSDSEAT